MSIVDNIFMGVCVELYKMSIVDNIFMSVCVELYKSRL